MKKILGIDIGTGSIGWAFLELNGAKSKMTAGVRVVPIDQSDRTNFEQGLAQTRNADRRRYRGMRRNLDRFQLRRERMIAFMLRNGWATRREELLQPAENDAVFYNRAKGVAEELTLLELGQVLLRINKNRGFKSNRRAMTEEEGSDFKQAIGKRDAELKARGMTIGEMFVEERQRWQEGGAVGPEPHFESRTYSRSSLIDEFEALWQEQSKYHPLTDALKREMRDECLFYQRRLKSQKHLIGKCPLEPSRRVAPKSSPLYQEFRVWQDVKNIRLTNEMAVSRPLDWMEQWKLVQVLKHQAKMTEAAIVRELGLHRSEGWKANMPLQGNLFATRVGEAIGNPDSALLEVDCTLQGDEFDKQPSMRLWHLLYATEENEALEKALKAHFSELDQEAIENLLEVRLPQDFGNLSHKAMRAILPFLRSEDAADYAQSASLAGYNHSQSETKDEKEKRQLLDRLQPIRKNSLRNPAVEKILNQYVNLLNVVMEDPALGRPDEIHIELSRELRSSSKSREKATKNNRQQEQRRKATREKLEKEYKLLKVTKNDILRYQLAEETGFISLYTGKPIQPSKLFGPDYDIDHIIPQSRLFDDGFMNKTIVERFVNEEKGNLTAMEYLHTKGEDAVRQYEARLKQHASTSKEKGVSGLEKPKLERLRMLSADIPQDFIERQLRETQYIAKEAYSRATLVAREVVPMVGSVTAFLRERWGLDQILEQINLPRYQAASLVSQIEINRRDGSVRKKTVPTDWSKRDDHRHHAMDAITVALVTRAHVQYLNTLNAQFAGENPQKLSESLKKSGDNRAHKLAPPLDNDVARDLTRRALEGILVSRKSGKRGAVWSTYKVKKRDGFHVRKHLIPRGQLHKETVYGKRLRYAATKTALSKLPANLALIVDGGLRALIQERLTATHLPPAKAFSAAALKKQPLLWNGEPVTHVQCFEEYFTQRVFVNEQLKVSEVIDARARALLQQRLDAHGGSPKKAFANLDEDPIWVDVEKKQCLRRVTVEVGASALQPLRDNGSRSVDFVSLRNNHHLALYRNAENGEIYPEIVSFIEAVHRRQQGESPIRTVDANGGNLVSTLAQDEYVLFDVEFENAQQVIAASPAELAPHIFRVQKMTYANATSRKGVDLYFRQQFETSLKEDNALTFRRVQSIGNLPSWKLRINQLGRVVEAMLLLDNGC